MNRNKTNFCLLVTLCCYMVVFLCYDAKVFESALLAETWIKTYMSLRTHSDTKVMFNLDREMLHSREGNTSVRKPLILMWNPSFGEVQSNPNLCPECVLTYDQTSADEADAIIFHCAETRNSPDWLPWQHRSATQRWVWLCMEPPWNVRHVFQKTLIALRGVFNWTMTYRTDSDVLSSYITFPSNKRSVAELMERKNSSLMAAWIVSNCHSPPREEFVNEISRYIPVDVYGKCSGNPLCRGDCQVDTLSRYRFYFSLENSQCRDYITEKFWRVGLGSGAVPVVMGPRRSDYELMAPPNSFIHVNDFPTVRALADHLVALSRNDTMYKEYLRWMDDPLWMEKQRGIQIDAKRNALISSRNAGNANGLCALCQKLIRTPKDRTEVVNEIDQWWFGRGYTPEGDSLPICESGSTASGYPLRWLVTLGYSVFFFFIVFCSLCVSRCRRNRPLKFDTNSVS
uniref:Fucosyltransferase n=1 Tax=Phallusia mammillata TaxID=59560 RepID=A0A6F9DCJ6_9ASCI|nr:alpha-(1,3)-fucosyltransferase 7-like [Phallusia mammillata]